MSGRSGFVNTEGARGKLYFLCGLPHSGKSTYANKWVREAELYPGDWVDGPGVARPRVVVSGDDFRMALTGHEYLPNVEIVISSFMDVATMALLGRGFDVLVDETSSSEMTLMRYFRMDPDPVPIFIDTPVDICKQRAVDNGRPYLLPVIDRIAKQLENVRTNWCSIRDGLKEKVEHRLHADKVIPAA